MNKNQLNIPPLFSLKYEFLFCLLIIIAITSIYGQAYNFEFVFDDTPYLTKNAYVQQGLTIDGIKWAFSFQEKDGSYWHPLTWLSHMADISLFGYRPGFHHLVNIFWHIANTCLLFFVLHRNTRMFWPSALVASLFAVHPLNVESVAWIAERKNLLSTFFWLLSIALYIYYTKRPSILRYIFIVCIFAMGLLAKPMLVTLPFVFLLVDFWPLQRISLGVTKTKVKQIGFVRVARQIAPYFSEKIPFFLIAILVSYFVTESLNEYHNTISFTRVSLSLRIYNIIVSYALYIIKLFWPADLAVFYPFPKSISVPQLISALLFLGGISFIIFHTFKEKKFMSVGWLWFLGTLTPVSGLIMVGLWPSLADRWAYIPFIGLFIIISWSINDFVNRLKYMHTWFVSVVIFIIFAFGTVSWHQVHKWRDNVALYSQAVSVTSDNYVLHSNLGFALTDKGRQEEAIHHLRRSLEIEPKHTDALNSLAHVLAEKGQFDEALDLYYKAIELNPYYFTARRNLVSLLFELGRNEEAMCVYAEGNKLKPNAFTATNNNRDYISLDHKNNKVVENYSKYLEVYPDDVDIHFNIANELSKQGKTEESIKHYKQALALDSNHFKSHNNLALLYDQLGHNESAITHFERALIIDPMNAELHYNIANSLAKVGRMNEAEKHFQNALEINPTLVSAHNNLGILLAQINKTEQAIIHFKKVLAIDPSSIDGYINIGVLLFNLGRREEALSYLEEAVKISPENKEIQRLLFKARSMTWEL